MYPQLYKQSITQPQEFWAAQATKFINWFKKWDKVQEGDFYNLDINWFTHAKLNACYNCVDKHLDKFKNKTAIIWEGNDPKDSRKISYQELYQEVGKFANALKSIGMQKGDRICLYLPMLPEAIVAMLACARIGAIHTVVFGGFSAENLKSRIIDAECRLLITADESLRGEKIIPLKVSCDKIVADCPSVEKIIVVKRTGNDIPWNKNRDVWYHELLANSSFECPPEIMDASDPLFILYTSGSTGKPKGIVHSLAGYLVYVSTTFYHVFNYQEQDIHWCTADIGWITGHSYLVYGPLSVGATTVMFEGVPNYPDFSRFWQIIDKHKINIFYTAPTALRSLRREGDQWVQTTKRDSLKILGSVGEPINPDVWQWYYEVVGNKKCPIVNTWWQTETGGIMLSQIPNETQSVAGSGGWPFYGIKPEIKTANNTADVNHPGELVIAAPWPGMMQTVYKDRQRFKDYFSKYPGKYLTGDGAYFEKDSYWITGRTDDVIKVSGHRIGTAEVENALVSYPAVAESAVVSVPDAITGESINAFVTLKADVKPTTTLKKELIQKVREKIGPLATPKVIYWARELPKTRSGKIMRRLLRKIANHEFDNFGDTSSLSNPDAIDLLIEVVKNENNGN